MVLIGIYQANKNKNMTLINAPIISTNPLKFSTDAGLRMRTSQLITLGDYKQVSAQCTLMIDRKAIGTGNSTYSATTSLEEMTTSATSDAYILQTKEFHNYFSGKSQKLEFTCINFHPQTNITKRAGYFSSNIVTPFDSDKDGIWLEVANNTYKLKISNNGTEIFSVDSADFLNATMWNTLLTNTNNLEKFNVFAIDFLWLGGAILRFWADVDGCFELIHLVKYAGSTNSLTKTFTRSPNQPLRYEIRQTGAGSGVFTYVCSQISSEGQTEGKNGVVITHPIPAITLNTGGTTYLVCAYRQKVANRDLSVIVDAMKLFSRANQSCRFELWLNPTITNVGTYADVNGTSLEFSAGNGSTITVAIGSGYVLDFAATSAQVSQTVDNQSYLNRFNHTIDGVADVICLVATPSANNTVVDCGISFRTL